MQCLCTARAATAVVPQPAKPENTTSSKMNVKERDRKIEITWF